MNYQCKRFFKKEKMPPFNVLKNHFESVLNGLRLNFSVTKDFDKHGSWQVIRQKMNRESGNEDNKFSQTKL